MTGFIHSIESMGLVDGPGVRSVVFMQGCLLRCKFCHNPDTWALGKAKIEMSADELVNKLLRFREYYSDDGGVTISGGEPLLQLDFATEVFTKLKAQGIHTCLDTAGVGNIKEPNYTERLAALLSVTDLVLLDIKHHDAVGYQQLTGRDMQAFDIFLSVLQETDTPIWIRQVVVPGITDSTEYIEGLKNYIAKLKTIENVKLLPYHTLGVQKYSALGIDYPLKNIPPMSKEVTKELEKILNKENEYAY